MKLQKTITKILNGIYIPLRIKLSISHLFVALVPSIIISFICYNVYSDSVLTETSARMESLVEETTQEIDERFDSLRTLLFASYMSSTIKDILYNAEWNTETSPDKKMNDYNKINDFFRGILYSHQNLAAIRLIPVEGISIIWHENTLTLGYPHPNIPWYQQIIEADIGEAYISPHQPLPPAANQGEVFTIGKAIRDIQGNVRCILMIDIKVEEIRDILNRISTVSQLQIAILNDKNELIVGSDNLQYEKFLDNDSVLEISNTRKGTLHYEVNANKYLLLYDTSYVSGWKFMAYTQDSVLVAKAEQIKNISLTVGLVSIIPTLMLSIFLSVRLTNPINKLYNSMEEVKNKNFNVYLHPSGHDEINRLTQNFNSMVKRIRNLIIKEYEADLRRKEAGLKALEAQINPHFLYNTLETISSIAYLEGIPEITTISKSLSQLFRYSINNHRRLVTLGDEMYHTLNYINIQKIRYGDKFSVVFEVNAELKDLNVIKLILQPLIENSIKHGLHSMKSGGLITVKAKTEGNTLLIEVKDNGVGINHNKLMEIKKHLNNNSIHNSYETEKSIGLANVHFRIRHYYGIDYGLSLESKEGSGAKITVKLPVISGRNLLEDS